MKAADDNLAEDPLAIEHGAHLTDTRERPWAGKTPEELRPPAGGVGA